MSSRCFIEFVDASWPFILNEIDVDLIPSDEYAVRTISIMSNKSIREVIELLQSEQVNFNKWNMGTTGVKCLSYILNSLY